MTPEQQTKLSAIKAALRRHIELSDNILDGPWEEDIDGIHENELAFIAHSRTVSPASAQATLRLIDVITDELNHTLWDDRLLPYAHRIL